MFKKLKDLLFNEEEYVEEEEVEVSRVKVSDSISKNQSSTKIPTVTKITPIEQNKVEEEIHLEKNSQSKVSALRPLTIDESEPQSSKAKLFNEPEREYEFSPVISPFFGVQGEEPVRKPVTKNERKDKKPSDLDTIISPFFGRIHEESNEHHEEHSVVETHNNEKVNDELTLEEILSQTEESSDAVQVSLFDANED